MATEADKKWVHTTQKVPLGYSTNPKELYEMYLKACPCYIPTEHVCLGCSLQKNSEDMGALFWIDSINNKDNSSKSFYLHPLCMECIQTLIENKGCDNTIITQIQRTHLLQITDVLDEHEYDEIHIENT